jgi:DNA-directed RNA polymerase subunit RPC12/RpoP
MPLKRFRCKECGKRFIAAIEPYEVGRITVNCPACGSTKLWEEKAATKTTPAEAAKAKENKKETGEVR